MPEPAAQSIDLPSQHSRLRAAAGPIVQIKDLRKSFGEQQVLDGISIDFQTAKTTVIMGPSGCGKSVMLKHIVGLIKPDAGEIFFDGNRIDTLDERHLQPVRLQIGLVFQMGALFDSMSVEDNIAFPLIEHTLLSKDERRERIAESLSTVDLEGVQSKLPSQLSGGQRKRVAIARALVLRPPVILFDEPTTGLDPIRSAGIDGLIVKLKEQMGVTNIVVTHDLNSARHVADRVVMLLGGKVAADGPYESLSHSDDIRVQHFLTGTYDKADEMNMSEGHRASRKRPFERPLSRIEERGSLTGKPHAFHAHPDKPHPDKPPQDKPPAQQTHGDRG